MGNPKAQVQKEYRERKKRQEGESFLEKERKRVKKYYVKTSDLTTKERKEQRKSTREREWKSFERFNIKQKKPGEVNKKMIVAMDFSSKSQRLNAKKRMNRQISKCKFRIPTLKQENLKIKRKNEALRKKLEWSKSYVTPTPWNGSRSNDTPNSKTKHQIITAGLKNVPPGIKKRLLLCVRY